MAAITNHHRQQVFLIKKQANADVSEHCAEPLFAVWQLPDEHSSRNNHSDHTCYILFHVLRLGFKISEQHLTSKWGHDSHDPSTHQVQQPDGTQRFEGTQTGTYDDNPVKAGRGDGVGIAGNGWFAVCSWGLREFLLIFGLACITGKGGKRMNGWEVTVHFVQCFSLIQRLWHLMQLWKSFLKWWWICWGLWQSSDVFGRP